jgi:hypothetical protein
MKSLNHPQTQGIVAFLSFAFLAVVVSSAPVMGVDIPAAAASAHSFVGTAPEAGASDEMAPTF